MLSTALFVLALAVPPAAPAPAAAEASAASDLRPVAGIEVTRARAHAQPTIASASASPELREPFAKTRAPIVQAPRAAAPLREPFKSGPRAQVEPRPVARESTALREPFSAR